MGREWHWSGRYSNRSGAGGEKDSTSSSGCMSAVFQFFDFHQFQFALHHQQPTIETVTSILPDEPFSPKGVEAPRNSLQSEELSFSLSTRERQEEDLNIPMSIQIRTSRNTGSKAGTPNEFSSEISSSPGTKTPNLVARLMGLDLLPETNSPSYSSSTHGTSTSNPLSKTPSRLLRPQQLLQTRLRKSLDKDITGTRSLPETPRVSSARKSDVDHRFSLQINKENLRANEDLEFSRFSYLRRKEFRVQDENNKSPSQHASQIVKQMKEKFSRKVGLDITNTVVNRDQGRTEVVSQIKSRKSSKAFTKSVEESRPGKHSSPSCSPRLRFYETKIKPSTSTAPSTNDKASHYSKPSSPLLSSPLNVLPQPTRVSVKQKSQPLPIRQQPVQKSVQKCKKMASERFGERLKKPPQTSDIIRNKKEEPFVHPATSTRANTVDKKCKKTPLSNGLLNITVPNLLPVKKDPPPPAPNVPQIESQAFDAEESRCSSQLPSSASQTYKQEATGTLMVRESDDDRSNGASTIGASGAEYEYVTNILSRTGIDKETAVSFNNWFSPSHPLDPSIFDQLTASTTSSTESMCMTGHLGYKCNQKLLFHVVDELLVGILKPYISTKPWASSKEHGHSHMQGSQLIDTLCTKIRSFPYANCRVLEDIDALIDKDLMHLRLQSSMAFEEEGEDIVTDIEKDILDSLMHEIVWKYC